ncbi:cation transporting ATPase C-terminal domain-containing protein [Ruegeria profundi]|uniref:cation transporting ATPase C-terminal domain-containing protein n=1 Tax=Ruegeria profundi TaxID=1685378 RepID=UPI001CD59675|nr:cation transporting ATPase C-terminal domain-containing protein [Ruegeria profundi]MCA0928433.1 cation transporting ATPase C-terminal domain-containing protein [Ruegeria profundi]
MTVQHAKISATKQKLTFDDVDSDLVLLGLLGLIDPPRDEAVAAVAECRAAGIRVKMITGNHAGTTSAIVRELGLENAQEVLTGTQIDGPEPHELVDAAEIVLADDNFATIAEAVRAGRTVYDYLKKASVFLLPVNGGEALALILALLLGLTLPITPVQILWVNMVSSVVLAIALAFEGPEPDIMRRPPRRADEPILSRFVLWRVGFVSLLFCAGIFGMFTFAQAQGASLEEARTIAVNTLVVMEIFYLFSVRFLNTTSLSLRAVLGTRPVLIAIAAVTALQFTFTYAPFMETFFETRPLSLLQGVLVVAIGPVLLVILELEKRILRRVPTRSPRNHSAFT